MRPITGPLNLDALSLGRTVSRPDGGFDVIFGGMECKAIAEERGVNFAYTPLNGWYFALRSYQPNVEAMKQYRMPNLERLS